MGHVSLTSAPAQSIKEAICKFLNDRNVHLSKLLVVGCDGTNVNTGIHNGVIRQLEELCGRPLQWAICQLHSNELPLRHLMDHLDGKTSGPRGFSGPIGKKLANCEDLPIVNYELIEGNFPSLEKMLLKASVPIKNIYGI